MLARYTFDFYEEARVRLVNKSLSIYLGELAWARFKEEHPKQAAEYRHCWSWELELDGADVVVFLMKD